MRAYRVAYDGRPYYGFQRQPDVTTVEGTLFDALRRLGVLDDEVRKPPGYAAAGRTDAGVSAVAQTVAFEAPAWLAPRALNSELPASVRAWASADVPDGFHATHHAVARTYTYHRYAPDVPRSDVEAVLDRLSGRHDFHNLTPDDRNTVRDLRPGVEHDGEFLVLRLRAGGFPREFVRRTVSLVVAVATDERDAEFLDRVLSTESLAGPDGVPPAPAYPLVLTDVDYPDVSFSTDEQAAKTVREVFEARRVERLAEARVAAEVASGVR